MEQSMQHQVAIITGAASGLGFAIAKQLSALGVQLALLDINTSALQENIAAFGTTPAIFEVDITNEVAVKQTIDMIAAQFGKIDILVNSAGITGITNTKSDATSTENIRAVFDVNFMGSYFTSKYVIPVMLPKKYGRILHIGSIAGKEGNAGMLAYSASKAAVIAMAKVQGKEYAETGITVNTIAPAVIRTAMHDTMPVEQLNYMTDKIPMKRCGTLQELANMVCFIVSPQNSFTTGFTFDLSGGRATY